jgi:hypothetical protein
LYRAPLYYHRKTEKSGSFNASFIPPCQFSRRFRLFPPSLIFMCRISGMRAVAIAALLGVLGDSAAAFQCNLSPSMVASPPAVSRREAIGACAFGALSMFPTLANAEAEKPLVPESEMIKPPANSCAQGVGGKCTELAEGCVCMNMHIRAHIYMYTRGIQIQRLT